MLTVEEMAKLLLDRDRLILLGMAARRPCRVDDLAAAVGGKRTNVVRALAQLQAAELVTVSGELGQECYVLDVARVQAMKQELFARPAQPEPATPDDKVLAAFVKDGRMTHLPSQHAKRLVVLRWLAGQFAPDREYTEREVNELLGRHGEDPATLRRYLVDHGLLTRGGGIYRRGAAE